MVSKYVSGHGECGCDDAGPRMEITDPERGEVFCGGCGLVLAQDSYEMSEGARRPDRRTGGGPAASLTIHDRGLSTKIGRDVDATGNTITGPARTTFNRLRVWDQRSKTRASSLLKALVFMNAMKARLGVPDPVAEDAAAMYRKAVAARLTRGRTTTSLAAASLYAACRRAGIPRSLDDVAAAAYITKKTISRDLRVMITGLNLDLDQYDTAAFVARIANQLRLRERVKRDALGILERSEEERITAGKHPVAQAAASLYLACIMSGEKVTQKDFAKAACVSDVAIRNRMVQIRKSIGVC